MSQRVVIVKKNIVVNQQKLFSLIIKSAFEDESISMYQMETMRFKIQDTVNTVKRYLKRIQKGENINPKVYII